MSRIPLNPLGSNSLGHYLREQRQSAKLSLRQLADLAGISNPYLSQVERGLKRPSAEILQQLAKGLEVSAESLYVQAGILDQRFDDDHRRQHDTRAAIAADPALNERQKAALLDIYDSFASGAAQPPVATPAQPQALQPDAAQGTARPARAAGRPAVAKSAARTTAARKTAARKTAAKKSAAKKSAGTARKTAGGKTAGKAATTTAAPSPKTTPKN